MLIIIVIKIIINIVELAIIHRLRPLGVGFCFAIFVTVIVFIIISCFNAVTFVMVVTAIYVQ